MRHLCRTSIFVAGLLSMNVALSATIIGLRPESQCDPSLKHQVLGERLSDIAHAFGHFFVLDDDGLMLKTKTGYDWEGEPITEVSDQTRVSGWSGVAASHDAVVVITYAGGDIYRRDRDGQWQEVFHSDEVHPYRVESTGKEFVVTGQRGIGGSAVVLYSRNQGRDWYEADIDVEARQNGFAMLSVAHASYWLSSPYLYRSADGVVWNRVDAGNVDARGGVVEKGGVYVNFIGHRGLYRSLDGQSWRYVSLAEGSLGRVNIHDLKVTHGQFIGVGACGHIFVSDTAENLVAVDTGFENIHSLDALASDGDTIIAVGQSNPPDENGISAITLVSKDGKRWENVSDRVRTEIAKFRATHPR